MKSPEQVGKEWDEAALKWATENSIGCLDKFERTEAFKAGITYHLSTVTPASEIYKNGWEAGRTSGIIEGLRGGAGLMKRIYGTTAVVYAEALVQEAKKLESIVVHRAQAACDSGGKNEPA